MATGFRAVLTRMHDEHAGRATLPVQRRPPPRGRPQDFAGAGGWKR